MRGGKGEGRGGAPSRSEADLSMDHIDHHPDFIRTSSASTEERKRGELLLTSLKSGRKGKGKKEGKRWFPATYLLIFSAELRKKKKEKKRARASTP